MGLRTIVSDSCMGDGDERCVFFCSTTERALPWIFFSLDQAEMFLEHCEDKHGVQDLRRVDVATVDAIYDAFMKAWNEAEEARSHESVG